MAEVQQLIKENVDNGEGGIPEQQQQEQHQQYEEAEHDVKPPRNDVCRDFLKNICNRGPRCKFYHPPNNRARVDEHINFCIDFQNRGCLRDNCRFVHASRDEVERYKITREVTLPLARAIAAVLQGDTIAGIPLCKEFQSGQCLRGAARCRYWHVNVGEERHRRARGLPPGPLTGGGGGPYPPPVGRGYPPTPGFESMAGGMRRPGGPIDDLYAGDMYGKRPRLDDQRMELERKNAELMKEVDILRRELQREHERYDDLYALFRQQTQAVPGVPPPPAAVSPGYPAGYPAPAWNPGTGSW